MDLRSRPGPFSLGIGGILEYGVNLFRLDHRGQHYRRTRHTPGAPAVQSFLTRKSSGQEPILRNFQMMTGRKGTLRSDPGKQEQELEKNRTSKEKKTTSGAEKETVMDPRTVQEQEGSGPPVAIREKGGPRDNTPKLRPRSGKSLTSASVWAGLKKIGGERRGARREGKTRGGTTGIIFIIPFVWWFVPLVTVFLGSGVATRQGEGKCQNPQE
ncbi:hypothetical protein NDU88_003249 [Pleurodeles waltl]|uniref:Uncharacterized protein n=1 Tax=Pleurodeles waltl TaxID=8319 RepID=A0AAV7VCU0_PLEWA|nr:hypothetical protein NDU88_003249 [Pleurodeles waltl]